MIHRLILPPETTRRDVVRHSHLLRGIMKKSGPALLPCLVVLCLAPAGAPAQAPLDSRHQLGLFNDVLADTVTQRAGTFRVAAPHLKLVRDPDAMPADTGGDNVALAVLDCDGDGDQDLLIGKSSAYPGQSALLRNDGAGHFTTVVGSGLPTYTESAARADLDNDGRCDLVVVASNTTRWQQQPSTALTSFRSDFQVVPRNELSALRAVGGGRFVPMPIAGPPSGHPNADAWPPGGRSMWHMPDLADIDRDGRVDLVARELVGVRGSADLTRDRFWLLLNRGDRFEAAQLIELNSDDSIMMGTATATCFDADNDGWPDLTMLPETGFFVLDAPVLVYANRDGRFAARADTLDADHGPKTCPPTWYDADADGDFDLLALQTDAQGGQHSLYLNDGSGRWRSLGAAAGLWSAYSLMNGASWADLDQDGLPDLIPCLNGAETSPIDISVRRNLGQGRFGTVWAALRPPCRASLSTAVCVDVDGDLDLDFIGAPRTYYAENAPADDNPVFLYRNESTVGRAIMLSLVGTRSNRAAIGARVEVRSGGRRQALIVGGGGTTGSMQPPLEQHCGLGSATAAERVTVSWPSGLIESWEELAAGRRWVLTEGSGTAVK
jgi:hypothetical protein